MGVKSAFSTMFGGTMGCLMALIAIPVLCIGGCVVIGMVAVQPAVQARRAAQEELEKADHQQKNSDHNVEAPVAGEIPKYDSLIPGLLPVDVYGNFSDRFKKEETFGEVCNWTLTQDSAVNKLVVEIDSNTPNDVAVISATYMNSNDPSPIKAAQDFLCFVSTVEYKDSEPELARKWVEENIENHDSSTIINGVKFEIFGETENMKILRISPVVDDQ